MLVQTIEQLGPVWLFQVFKKIVLHLLKNKLTRDIVHIFEESTHNKSGS